MNRWITKAFQKPFKRKQNNYDKFLKAITIQNENKYNQYKALLEVHKEKSKKKFTLLLKFCFVSKIRKKSWCTIKKTVGKAKFIDNNLPKMMIVGNIVELVDQR